MIGKGKSITHGGKGIDYALNKDAAEVIDKRYITGDNGVEIKNEFKIFQQLNNRCKKNDLSFVISPEPKDGKALTNEDFKKISEVFLKKMKLENHQAIVIKHQDKEHTHLHIFANRIDSNGKAYKDNYIGFKSQRIADEVANERGLTRASLVREFNKSMTNDLRQQIFLKHKAVLEHKPKDFESYIDLMKASGVEVNPTINKAGKLQGYRVKFQGQDFKASEVNRAMTLSKMTIEKATSKVADIALNTNPLLKVGLQGLKAISRNLSHGFGI